MTHVGPLTTIADRADEYAARGWNVFPAPPGEKKSHIAAEHDPHGRKWGATNDPAEVRRNWQQWPGANVGIVTGAQSGFFVIEADTPKGHGVDGVANLMALIEEHGPIPDTIEAESPSGSKHFYFRHPGGVVPNSAGKIGPGIDVRGDGGMVIAPPSVKPGAAKAYRWKNPPGFFEPADCPPWLLTMALTKPEKERPAPSLPINSGGISSWAMAALQGEAGRVMTAPEGQRNATLNHSAFRLGQIVAGGGLNEGEASAALYRAAMAAGLDATETEATIASGMKAGALNPRGPDDRAVSTEPPATARADPPAMPRVSRFLAASTLAGWPIPAREWLVPDLIPARNVTSLYGDGGTGKSLLALQLAVATATGRDWIGREVTPGRALYLSAEDEGDELHRRLAGILPQQGIDWQDLDRLTLRSVAGEDSELAASDPRTGKLTATELYHELEAEIARDPPALVILDTLADLHDGDENDRKTARRFIGTFCRGLALRHGCAVVVLAHPSLTGLASGTGTGGNTAWSNSVRSRLYLERLVRREAGQPDLEPDPDARRLTVKKSNYGRTGEEIALRWEAGAFVVNGGPSRFDAQAGAARADRVFLKLLRLYTDQGRRVNDKSSATYAPKVFAEHPQGEGISKRAFAAAMERLLEAEKVIVKEEGPPSRRVSYLAPADQGEAGNDL